MEDVTIEALHALPRKRGRALVFDMVYNTARRLLAEIAARADVARFTPHALRHTRATLSLLAGDDLADVSQQLGHASLSTTQRYTHLLPQQLRARRSKIVSIALNGK